MSSFSTAASVMKTSTTNVWTNTKGILEQVRKAGGVRTALDALTVLAKGKRSRCWSATIATLQPITIACHHLSKIDLKHSRLNSLTVRIQLRCTKPCYQAIISVKNVFHARTANQGKLEIRNKTNGLRTLNSALVATKSETVKNTALFVSNFGRRAIMRTTNT